MSKRIALLTSTRSEWNRKVLSGITHFADDVGGWRFDVPPVTDDSGPCLPKGWQGDGVIGRVTNCDLRSRLEGISKPVVNVSWQHQHSLQIPSVLSSESTCAEMATEFFLEKQFTSFAYFGFHPSLNYQGTIQETIREMLKSKGRELSCFEFPKTSLSLESTDLTTISQWLKGLSRPTAIIAWSSFAGHKITLACEESGLSVPEDIAILCIEHDHVFSSLAPIPLTNIDQDPWRVGYTAAKLLNDLMNGVEPPQDPILIPPISVVQRMSTEATVVRDEQIALATRFVYKNARVGIGVIDVVKHVGISRRALETKFKKFLGCTPAAYIRRIQLQCVAKLLRTTQLSIAQVALKTGFEYPEVMMRAFKREYGMTPLEFRQGSVE